MSHHQATEHTISTTEQSETESIFSDVYDTSVYKKTLKNARIWLFVIAGFQFAMGIFEKTNDRRSASGLDSFFN